MNAADYLERQLVLFDECECPRGGDSQDSLYGRTYPEHSALITGLILKPCLKRSDRPRFQCLLMANGQRTEWHNYLDVRLPGGSSMLSGSCLKGAKESSLSQILQKPEDVPQKYYLSPKACIGILRRAKQRGKELPMQLKKALEAQGGGVLNVSIDKTATLRAQEHGHQPIVLDMTHANDVIRESKGKTPTLNARMGTGGNQVPLLMENIPKTIGCDLYNGSISGDQAVGLTAASGASANHSGPAVAYCIAGNMVDRETKQHGLGISKEIASTLTAVDRHAVVYDAYQHHNWRENETVGTLTTHNAGVRGDTPLVMSTTGGQKKAWCVGNGQVHQLYLQEKAGTLNCMSEQQYVMQQVTESKLSEASAPMTEEDSTDKM